MIDGNILDFTSKHPEVNRLRLVCPPLPFSLNPQTLIYPEARGSDERIAVPPFHGNRTQRPQARAHHHSFSWLH